MSERQPFPADILNAAGLNRQFVFDLADLPEIERQRIEAFFRVYKDLPKGRNPVQLNGYGDAKEAKALIQASLERFSAQP